MDINSLLKIRKCACGREHSCDIENIYIECGAIARLSELCKNYKSILLVGDENTFFAAIDKTEKALLGKKTRKVVFDGKTVLIPNEEAINRVKGELDGIDLIIGIGSGVVQDLCKYVAHFASLPYMIVATAPSMDGYASSGAAMILKGMKETVSARLPRAIIADVDVLKNAPMEMIKAGYGDIIGKYSALCDWELSREVNNEYFCDYIYKTTYSMVEKTLLTKDGLLKRNEESIKALTEALIVVGIMMSFATTSRPASGSEHHLSHFFEITGILNSEKYLAHGIDVAYSTVITAKIREKILNTPWPNEQFSMENGAYVAKIGEIYGKIAPECISLQQRVGNYKINRISIYKDKEQKIRELFSKMPRGEEIEKMLSDLELDINELYNTYGEEKIKNAVRYAKDLKDRYTVLWMNYDLFGDK
ncbi:MAG: sn-glycerol-1-phosphate dehydrogenase [Clostridia bacterium]|nr:sn-glycerol-1-phosphate dehydrogenase [Clostridia bacterium]MBQ7788364.1 sn-glycerol-1-phosphate dehydrogenase [Clostridia bacterium]